MEEITINQTAEFAGKRISKTEEVVNLIRSRQDLSYFFFDDLIIENIVARQSLFNGALFRNCTIVDCDFSRSDFEGTRFENCRLVNVSFHSADIRSTKFYNSKLERCSFRSTMFTDNILQNCTLTDGDFEEAVILHCIFKKTHIRKLQNRAASWLHITFDEVKLEAIEFSDCTANYFLFTECSLNEIRLNADMLGMTYGLSEKELKNISFAFLGKEYDQNHNLTVEDFAEQYLKRNWILHVLILQLNFHLGKRQKIIFDITSYIYSQVIESSGVKRDDVEFIFNILQKLKEKGLLPFSTAINMYDKFSPLLNTKHDHPLENEIINLIMQKSFLLASEMKTELIAALEPLFSYGEQEQIRVEITYLQKQEIDSAEFIKLLQPILLGSDCSVNLLATRSGSWIETIQMTVTALIALYVALYTVNGCLVQITLIRARGKRLFSKNLPRKFIQAANEPTHELPIKYTKLIERLCSSQVMNEEKTVNSLQKINGDEVTAISVEDIVEGP